MIATVRTLLTSAAVTFVLSTSATSQQPTTKTVFFEQDNCLHVDVSAPQVENVRTARRFSLNAPRGFFLEATSFDLLLPDIPTDVSMRFRSATIGGDDSPTTGFASCNFVNGIAGFQKQINSDGLCGTSLNGVVYHTDPFSPDNITVRCGIAPDMLCGMSFVATTGEAWVTVSVSTLENPPETWVSIAQKVREFVSVHVDFSSQC